MHLQKEVQDFPVFCMPPLKALWGSEQLLDLVSLLMHAPWSVAVAPYFLVQDFLPK